MNYAIMQFFKKNHNILIGERTAEAIKCEVGSAVPLKEEITIQVKGRDLVGGIPKTTEVSSVEIREALNEAVVQIVDAVRQSLKGLLLNFLPISLIEELCLQAAEHC